MATRLITHPSPFFQIVINQLKDKVENIKKEVEEKSGDINSHTETKTEARNELNELITNCEQLYSEYDIVRIQVSSNLLTSLHYSTSAYY